MSDCWLWAYSHEIGTLFSPISAPFPSTSAVAELGACPAHPVTARAIFRGADFHANGVPRLSENRVPKFVQFCTVGGILGDFCLAIVEDTLLVHRG
jgi:hypothetical protein